MVSGQTIMEGLNGWKDAERYERFMHRLHHCDVLLYDHLGWEQGRDERISSAIERLLRDRIESGRSLFVTTNQDEHGLASKFGKEFSSQINGACVSHEWTIDKDWHNHSPLAEFEAKHHVIFPVVC